MRTPLVSRLSKLHMDEIAELQELQDYILSQGPFFSELLNSCNLANPYIPVSRKLLALQSGLDKMERDIKDKTQAKIEYDPHIYWKLPLPDVQVHYPQDTPIDTLKRRVKRMAEVSLLAREFDIKTAPRLMDTKNLANKVVDNDNFKDVSKGPTVISSSEIDKKSPSELWLPYEDGWVSVDYFQEKMMQKQSLASRKNSQAMVSTMLLPAGTAEISPARQQERRISGNHFLRAQFPIRNEPQILKSNEISMRIASLTNLEAPIHAAQPRNSFRPSVATLNHETSREILSRQEGAKKGLSFILPPVPGKPNTAVTRNAFRYIFLLRSLCVAVYGTIESSKALGSPAVIKLGAQELFIGNIAVLWIDVLVSLVKAFPSYLWCFWDVKTFDPIHCQSGIWSLVADHNLITDMMPLMANLAFEIYLYRVAEVIANANAKDTICFPFLT